MLSGARYRATGLGLQFDSQRRSFVGDYVDSPRPVFVTREFQSDDPASHWQRRDL
jgi:hypothetical protein